MSYPIRDIWEEMMETAIQAEGIKKIFSIGTKKFYALDDVSVLIPIQGLTIFKGRSGSGKTTLLNILGALDAPSAGEVVFLGEKLSEKTGEELEKLRRYQMGFVFQSAAMIPYMSAYENVEFALRLSDYSGDRGKRVREILGRVGLLKRMEHMPDELSGGERQRVAVARALAHHPAVIFADEPTGAVDSRTAGEIMALFRHLNETLNLTILIVTHDMALADSVSRIVMISDGKVSTEKIKRKTVMAGFGEEEESHEEFAVMDRANRLQLKEEFLDAAGINSNKVKVEVENGKIVISRKES